MNPELNTVLERLLEKARANADSESLRGDRGRLVKCAKCRDTGWIFHESGTFETAGGNEHHATEASPIAARCRCRPKPLPKAEPGVESFS